MRNNRKGNKKLSLLLVLRALELMSSEKQPMKQVTLANMVNLLGDTLKLEIWCDRKTVGRHLKTLSAVGYQIVHIKGKGYYLKNDKFTSQENELLIKIIENSNISSEIKNSFINKLRAQENTISPEQLGKYFKSDFLGERFNNFINEEY